MKMRLTNIQDLMDSWEKDSIIDETKVGVASLNIPRLHSKYSNYLINHNLIAKKLQYDLSELRSRKFLYYTGQIPKDELDALGWEPYHNPKNKIMKTDAAPYLDTDKDIKELTLKKLAHDEIVDFCKSIIKELGTRTYEIKNYIEQQKYFQGVI